MDKSKRFVSAVTGFVRKHFLPIGILLVLIGCYAILECSCILDGEQLWEYMYVYRPVYGLLNVLTIGAVWTVFLLISRRYWAASLICTVLCGGIGIANHYVISFHGMPLSFLLIKNFNTAMNVISGYTFAIDIHVSILILITLILLVLCFFIYRKEKVHTATWRQRLLRDLILTVVSACVIFFGYFSPNPIKPTKTIAWLWREAYGTYGYLACSIETLCQLFETVAMPEGYSTEKVSQIQIGGDTPSESANPDIILIINESFYDLQQVLPLETDIPYMENIGSMDNLLYGYAVSPNTGGGTNVSEYEVLTSNSTFLMPGVTPFNLLDLREANSAISVLAEQGYSSLACHPAAPANYSRSLAYPALGFQQIYFRDDFENWTYYADRPYISDTCVYENLIRWYNQADFSNPQFLYALTIQNHGNWEMNSPEEDLVHLVGDYGPYADQMEEFLSCIYLSDKAFADLTEYFSQSERPVIICMVGDHAPAFTGAVVDPQYSADEKALRTRKIPLMIWANFTLPEMELGTMSMNYVLPTLLDIAGVELTPYYRYMLQLKEHVPILTSYGSYYDSQGTMYQYSTDSGSPWETAVDNYFYLEYHNLQPERDQSLFRPES